MIVERLWSALYDRRDFDEVGSLFSSDGRYQDMPLKDEWATGPAEVAARLRLGLDRLERYWHDVEQIIAEGDTVMTEHVEHWLFPTGELVSLPFVSVHRVRDDQVVLWRDYWDWNTLMDSAPRVVDRTHRRRLPLTIVGSGVGRRKRRVCPICKVPDARPRDGGEAHGQVPEDTASATELAIRSPRFWSRWPSCYLRSSCHPPPTPIPATPRDTSCPRATTAGCRRPTTRRTSSRCMTG